ncbi:MAG: hypothetical protein D6737_15390 [Chloroflexi bacterium]|nr:MAG: hypothetical protein D6737_15390 [Chloroflexota bacterium]
MSRHALDLMLRLMPRWGFLITSVFLLLSASVAHGQDTITLLDENDKLLVWIGEGPEAGRHNVSNPGSLFLLDNLGNIQPLINVRPQTQRVHACGEGATSPDGRYFAFFMGLDEGELFLMRDAETPVVVDTIQALACVGSNAFQYSPDGRRFAYIAYEAGVTQDEFADGILKIFDLETMTQEIAFENVTAFDMNNEGVASVIFFTNTVGEADEAAISWWDGTSQREISTLFPDNDNCKFTSADIIIGQNDFFWVVVGHRCTVGDARTHWQLYQIDVALRGVTLISSAVQGGVFATFARTNNLFFSPNMDTLFFTVPDGATANTTGIMALNLADNTLSMPIERQVVMPTYSGMDNSPPHFSPDGRWMAMVVTTPNNDNTLTVLDLTNPSLPPITFAARRRGEVISHLAFTSDSQRLIFVAGETDAGDNSLFALDLDTGSEFRVRRGRFAPGMIVSPDGTRAALSNWQIIEDSNEPPFQNFTVQEIETSVQNTLFIGAQIVDNKVTNQTFIFPLSWRRSG